MNLLPRILPAGDQALLIELGREIKPEFNRQVHALAQLIESQPQVGIKEIVPSYCSLLIYYDPFLLSFSEISGWIENLLQQRFPQASAPPVIKEIPVLYGGEYGPDLYFVAQYNGLTIEEVIRWHTSETYLVYVVGFSPGFAAMGIVPSKIRAPRLATPRLRVPAGSVGIGGAQTGIYAVDSPGGWQLIGRTPLKLFDLSKDPPVYFQAGDYARFFSITEAQYQAYQINLQSIS